MYCILCIGFVAVRMSNVIVVCPACRPVSHGRRVKCLCVITSLETMASEVTSLRLKVNWQNTKVQASSSREDEPSTITVLGQEVAIIIIIIIIQGFKHVKSSTKVKNLKCEKSQCHRRNARLYRAVVSLDLTVTDGKK